MENQPNRILILDTAWLGDVIFTSALLGSVRLAWPSSAVDVLVAPRGKDLLVGHPQIRKLWVYDKSGSEKSAASLLRLGKTLRAENYDLILNAHPSFRSRLLTYLTQAELRVGYEGFLSTVCLTHSVKNDLSVEADHVKRRLDLLKALDIKSPPAPLYIPVSEQYSAKAKTYLQSVNFSDKRILGLIPGSAWKTKQWPEKNFAELALQWIAEKDGRVLVFGGKNEAELAGRIAKVNSEKIKTAVELPLPEVGALLRECEIAVGNDTGISFLAAAVGAKKVLALYGCTQINYDFPLPHKALHAGVPCCLPRTGHGAQACKWSESAWCMRELSVERVWKEV